MNYGVVSLTTNARNSGHDLKYSVAHLLRELVPASNDHLTIGSCIRDFFNFYIDIMMNTVPSPNRQERGDFCQMDF